MSTPVEQIKGRLGIVDVVGSYIKLERAGANMRARCPFHNEKTPSFSVSPAREGFHCFGCGKGGDIFTFVQEIEGVDFPEALKILAARAGVELKREDPRVRSERERLTSILEESTQFFETSLAKNELAKEYLKGRGLTPESIKAFRVGFAPSDWRALYSFLQSKNYTDAEIEKAGLTVRAQRPGPNGEAYFDRFRSRVMFPLSTPAGVVVGFSGRIFGDAPPDTAKYVNSPQTPLYDKSHLLYGYDKAKNSIREKDACVLVEGQMDIVLSHQAGVTNTVAVSGTALTEFHLGLVNRLTKNLVVAFDPDSAGVNAAARGVDMALVLGMDVRAARLPEGLDPADLVRKDPALWVEAVANAKHIILFFLEYVVGRGLDPRELRMEVERRVLPYVARIKSPMDQAHFINTVAHAIGLPEEAIRDAVITISKITPSGSVSMRKQTGPPTPQLSRRTMIQERLLGLIAWQEGEKERRLDFEKLLKDASEVVGDGFELLRAASSEENTRRAFEVEALYGSNAGSLEKVATELLHGLRQEILREERQKLEAEVKAGEKLGENVDEKIRLIQNIDQTLQSLKNVE